MYDDTCIDDDTGTYSYNVQYTMTDTSTETQKHIHKTYMYIIMLHTVGWVTGRASSMQKPIPSVLFYSNTQLFYGPFFQDYLGEPVPEEIFLWTLWCKGR